MKKVVVADVPTGTICRHKGWWGVLGKYLPHQTRWRRFDRWDAPDTMIETHAIVEIPTRRSYERTSDG